MLNRFPFCHFLFIIIIIFYFFLSAWSHLIQTGSRYWSNWDDGSLILSIPIYPPSSLPPPEVFISLLSSSCFKDSLFYFILFSLHSSISSFIPHPTLIPFTSFTSSPFPHTYTPFHSSTYILLHHHYHFYYLCISTGISIVLLPNSTLVLLRPLWTACFYFPYLPASPYNNFYPSEQTKTTNPKRLHPRGRICWTPFEQQQKIYLLSLPSATENLAKQNDTFRLVPLTQLNSSFWQDRKVLLSSPPPSPSRLLSLFGQASVFYFFKKRKKSHKRQHDVQTPVLSTRPER